MIIREVGYKEKDVVKKVVDIHIRTFKGFFLTFMGKRFLRLMYSCYTRYYKAGLLVATDGDDVLGFLAYSEDLSGLYRYMMKHGFFSFAWYAFLAFLRRPKAFFRLFAALKKPKDAEREERYVELASIGVDPEKKRGGVGSELIKELKNTQMIGIFSTASCLVPVSFNRSLVLTGCSSTAWNGRRRPKIRITPIKPIPAAPRKPICQPKAPTISAVT